MIDWSWWKVDLSVCRGTCQAQGCICCRQQMMTENVCDCWIRAMAFGRANVLFLVCPLLFCISVYYIPCSICFKCPSPLFCMRESHSCFEVKWKLKATLWKSFSLDPCIFHTYTWLRGTYIKSFSFSFYSVKCLSKFILVISISHESRQHLTFRNHNHHGLAIISSVWSVRVCVFVCVCVLREGIRQWAFHSQVQNSLKKKHSEILLLSFFPPKPLYFLKIILCWIFDVLLRVPS